MNGKIVNQNYSRKIIAPAPIKAGQGLTKTMASPLENAMVISSLPKVEFSGESFYGNVVSAIVRKFCIF